MLVKKISNTYADNIYQIIFSVVDDQFCMIFSLTDASNISTLVDRVNDHIAVNNRTDPNKISYNVSENNITFNGDIDITLEVLKDAYFISEKLCSYLINDKEIRDFINQSKLEIDNSSSQESEKEAKSSSGKPAFFKGKTSTPPGSNATSSVNFFDANISRSEIAEIQELQKKSLVSLAIKIFKPADNSVEKKTSHLSERKMEALRQMADKVQEDLVNRVLKAEVELRETCRFKEEEIPELLQQLYDGGLKAIEDNLQSIIEQAIKTIRERREAGVGKSQQRS